MTRSDVNLYCKFVILNKYQGFVEIPIFFLSKPKFGFWRDLSYQDRFVADILKEASVLVENYICIHQTTKYLSDYILSSFWFHIKVKFRMFASSLFLFDKTLNEFD